ncbi:PTS sugar transporter subunit IIA [Biformimicrobium ophioploci]|uniref:PTS IIA-like nitrogen regulatory protein PtsN n=1 Tax=Biformimicrobium ophioploci TaxID=3036711 RepID=A0ABQ6LWW1_9GAMM|nr:PTS sugar transporter subunit IIA [Microbulbifer sp. NKW57]GMG86597.1 PTS IIA-like nitrogen regulatory protein PtsN [Microbulbifer sp. NKW57]
MSLNDVVDARLCLPGLAGSSKKRILQNLAQAVTEIHPDLDADDLFQHLVAREKLGSTGIGEGVAIPHCRIPGSEKVIAALCTTETPADFGAIDRRPVDIVFLLAVPEGEDQAHLNLLAEIAERLQSEEVRAKLRAAHTSEQLLSALQPQSQAA